MPRVRADRLREIARVPLAAGGVPEAATVARHRVAANLAGHDSHGIIRIPGHVERVRAGHTVPGAPFEVVRESPTTTMVDGHRGFGCVVNERAMRLTIERRAQPTSPPPRCSARAMSQGHVGRLASYPLVAAEAGMIGMAWADSGHSPTAVAPSGGARRGSAPTPGPSPCLRIWRGRCSSACH